MPNLPTPDQMTPAQVLLTNRIIWGAILGGLIIVSVMLISTTLAVMGEPMLAGEEIASTLTLIMGLFALLATATGWGVREMIYRKAGSQPLSPQTFTTANISFLAAAEGAGIIAMIGFLLTGSWALPALTLVLIGVIAINFPNGRRLASQPDA